MALSLISVFLLAGCASTSTGPRQHPVPAHSATPVFATEEEALAAAEAAYRRYQIEIDLALSTHELDNLDLVASGSALSTARRSVEAFRTSGSVQTGISAIDTVSLAQRDSNLDQTQIYACLDVSATEVLDSSGASIASPSRQFRFPMLVTVDEGKVSREEVWDGEDFCD